MTGAWTTLAEVRGRLRRRWERGEFLSAWAAGTSWTPMDLPLRGPSPGELAARFDQARTWRQGWKADEARLRAFRLETRSTGSRSIGANELPARLLIDSYEGLWRLLDTSRDVRRFGELRAATGHELPGLADWMNAHPIAVLAHEREWLQLVRTVRWLETARGRGTYLRQIPIPGVDTKFIETHRGVLADLLDWLLPEGSVDFTATRAQFERRYGFATRPLYVRLRFLGNVTGLLPGATEVSLRAEEFNLLAPDVSTVFIVENEVTYLAFPDAPDAMVLLGSGYALSAIASLPWLTTRRVRYWGDIDTHGFAILDQLRRHAPHVESMLMDHQTLLEHREQWVREPTPTQAMLGCLSPPEAQLYRDLVEDTIGPAVRLEQERVSFPSIKRALGVSLPCVDELRV